MAAPEELKRLDLQALLSMPAPQASVEINGLLAPSLERLRTNLWDILGSVGRKEEFLGLQRILASKGDLTFDTLSAMPLPLGKILVAVRTGIQAFLHPSVQMSQQHLAEIFLQRRCKNMACQSVLPAGDCACHMCSSRAGFCNLCMCVVCKKFDFETNTCRWIGCDFCLHWCHSECAIHMAHIRTVNVAHVGTNPARDAAHGVAPAVTGDAAGEDTAFCCPSCGHCSDLIGFVKDVFEMCAEQWEPRSTRNELECVRTMFGGSSNARGVQLLRFVSKVLADLDQGMDHRQARQEFRTFLASELARLPPQVTAPPPTASGAGAYPAAPPSHAQSAAGPTPPLGPPFGGSAHAPSSGPSRPGDLRPGGSVPGVADSARTGVPLHPEAAVMKDSNGQVEVIFLDEEGAKSALADVDREVELKRREMTAVEEERKKREHQLDELQNVAESREADAKRLEAEAEEARKEVQVLQHIIQVKRRTAEREYDMKRGALGLEETEAKKQKIIDALERMRARQTSGGGAGQLALAGPAAGQAS